jgi:hypothetical protein
LKEGKKEGREGGTEEGREGKEGTTKRSF